MSQQQLAPPASNAPDAVANAVAISTRRATAALNPAELRDAIDEVSATVWKCADRLARHGNNTPAANAALADLNHASRKLTLAALRLSDGSPRDARSMLDAAGAALERSAT